MQNGKCVFNHAAVERPSRHDRTHNDILRRCVCRGGLAEPVRRALVLGRVPAPQPGRRDAGEPRNAPSAHLQGYLSREALPPAEFLAVWRAYIAQVLRGGRLVRTVVVGATAGTLTSPSSSSDGRTVRARQL
ncbi:hypothetical protein GCM10017687_43480 [Streptomyces echinatus]